MLGESLLQSMLHSKCDECCPSVVLYSTKRSFNVVVKAYRVCKDANRSTPVQICCLWQKMRQRCDDSGWKWVLTRAHFRSYPSCKGSVRLHLMNIRRQQQKMMVRREIRETTGALCNFWSRSIWAVTNSKTHSTNTITLWCESKPNICTAM